ncbi:MAG: Fis family transcriptional regulator, partial [Spirochaetales bacterium]|nr:Fis family transcriptional regulator [Spirochaetales bacterium]
MSVSTTHIFGTDPQVIEPLNADIIVARGITATAIALQKPSVHVVPINWSNADLLSALAQAKTVSPRGCIGLITNEQLCEQDELSTLLGLDVSVFQVTDQNDVIEGVTTLQKLGCTVFVGGLTMCRICEERNLS